MVTPVKKAAKAPDGDSERLRKPWPARKVAMRIGTNGRSDTLKDIVEDDHPWETRPSSKITRRQTRRGPAGQQTEALSNTRC